MSQNLLSQRTIIDECNSDGTELIFSNFSVALFYDEQSPPRYVMNCRHDASHITCLDSIVGNTKRAAHKPCPSIWEIG